MPFGFSRQATLALAPSKRSLEDRRSNPVRGRETLFRLIQRNMLSYTFDDFVPGFGPPGVSTLPFRDLVRRPTENARAEGELLYPGEFSLSGNQVAKVEGDIFEIVEAAIHWNAATLWNSFVASGKWPSSPRLPRPVDAGQERVGVLSLPRRYDWVRLLVPAASKEITALRDRLSEAGLSLPTSTPDILVVELPNEFWEEARFSTALPNLGAEAQSTLSGAHRLLEGKVTPGRFLLAIALKKSLRSDRLYQPLYEANVMQLLLEGLLNARQVDFEVHTLESAGTRAIETYRAASLGAVASGHASPHRAVRDLYEPPTAAELVRRFLAFLANRLGGSRPP